MVCQQCQLYQSSYWNLCRVHEAQPEVVFLYNVQMVHDLLKQFLTFGFFLMRKQKKKGEETSASL